MKALSRLCLFAFVLFTAPAFAGATPYTQAAFDQLQQQGKPILVAVHADWCPTCRAQAPIIGALLQQDKFRGITALRVDFDTQKDVVRSFRVFQQSTLIVFKGGKEVGRSLGDTTRAGIERLLERAL